MTAARFCGYCAGLGSIGRIMSRAGRVRPVVCPDCAGSGVLSSPVGATAGSEAAPIGDTTGSRPAPMGEGHPEVW